MIDMNDVINLRKKTEYIGDYTVIIQEYCISTDISCRFDLQSGSRLMINPKYDVKILPKGSSSDNNNMITKFHYLCMTMEECYERFPWFFSNG